MHAGRCLPCKLTQCGLGASPQPPLGERHIQEAGVFVPGSVAGAHPLERGAEYERSIWRARPSSGGSADTRRAASRRSDSVIDSMSLSRNRISVLVMFAAL